AVEVAAVAAEATAVAATSVAAAAARTRSPASATARSARATGAGFVHHDFAAVELGAVQLVHGGLALFIGREFDESESARASAHAVDDDRNGRHVAESLELLAQAVLGRRVGQVANKKTHTDSPCLSLPNGV